MGGGVGDGRQWGKPTKTKVSGFVLKTKFVHAQTQTHTHTNTKDLRERGQKQFQFSLFPMRKGKICQELKKPSIYPQMNQKKPAKQGKK